MSAGEAMKELIAAAEAAARAVKDGGDSEHVEIPVVVATRLINAVVNIRTVGETK